jgi:Flp pilus assembly protein TadG
MFVPKRRLDQDRPRERGVVIIYTAFFMLLMLGFVAVGIDVSKLMATRTQLQRAADAAALAGASAINFKNGEIIPDSASMRAQYTSALNSAFVKGPTSVVLLAGDISYPTPNQVKVVVRRDPNSGGEMVTHIAQVLGITSIAVTATATAIVEPVSEPCDGLIPMAPVELPGAGWFDPACNGNQPVEYSLKVDAGNGTQGNYQLLDYPECNEGACGDVQGGGGAAIRCQTANGYGCCIDVGQDFTLTQPGNKVGPFRQGMTTRWDSDTDRRENICYQNYTGNGKRVVRLPIVETFNLNGKKVVRIKMFAAFFLTRRPGGGQFAEMWGQFIYETAPGTPGNNPGTLYTIHLIQ